MKIDIKDIKRQGKTEESFFFLHQPTEQLIDIPNAELLAPVKVSGTVSLTGEHSAYVEGEICYEIKGECTRCLTSTQKTYTVEFAEEVEPNNPEGYSMVCDKVDLAKIVEDKIIISAPISFLCKDDCKGICTGCGVNLNQGECECKK